MVAEAPGEGSGAVSARDEILARVRAGLPAPVALPEMPPFARGDLDRLAPFEDFAAALQRMGGKVAEPPAGGDLAAWLRVRFPGAKVVCSAAPEFAGNRPLEAATQPHELEDVDVGVVRAAFGVAETGSVLLTEAELKVEAIAFLPQHLVVLLDPARIVATLHDGYRAAAFAQARYAIFLTGPSATADIEGVLIHGAQGVRSLTVVPVAAPAAPDGA
jgi:L-lactate dehydrogenase complex protein LldG